MIRFFLVENFSSKKIRKLLVEKKIGTKNFRFLPGIFFDEKVNENSKFQNFENFSKFENFEFSLTFSTIFFRSKIEKFWSQKIFDQTCSDFFSRKKCRPKKSYHLFRSEMISRFRKLHLEQRATIIKIRTARTKKIERFFVYF